jgi:GT2 family glycosyltransferase
MTTEQTPPQVDIVVLNWNGHDEILRCVHSIEHQLYRNFRILVLDNGSTDGSAEALRKLGNRITLIESSENLGYAGGNNLAMREAFARGADYVWLFNSDALAPPDTLARMIEVCEADGRIGLASPLIREENDRIQFAGRMFDLTVPDTCSTDDIGQARTWQADHPDRIALTGTAMLVSRALFERIGGLDDSLFAYWEDTDYSIRSATAGFRNIVVFDVSIFHPGKPIIAAPDAVKPHYYYFMARNELLLWRKCCSRMRFLKLTVWVVRHRLVQIARMPDNRSGIDAILAGVWDGYRGRGGRYDSSRRMIFPLRYALARYPRFWIRTIDAVT